MDKYVQENRSLWNDLTTIHRESAFYDVAAFRAGKSSLKPLELAEVGDVAGRSLLHLQCHFGLDTLSWARLGANVTGVDLSEKSIALAEALSREVGIEARFLCADIYQLPTILHEQFDILFTSYGVLCWLSDLQSWARIVADYLKPGGIFYLVDYHPMSNLLAFADNENELLTHYPFVQRAEPQRIEWRGSYANSSAGYSGTAHLWEHGLSDVINAILSAKLQLEYVHEFPCCLRKLTEADILKIRRDDLLAGERQRPHSLLFSLKASRVNEAEGQKREKVYRDE